MIRMSDLIFGAGYLDGAPVTTDGKKTFDGNSDRLGGVAPANVRKQNRWLNANTTDIPTMVSSATARTIGVSVTTQVDSPFPAFNAEAEALIEEHNRLGVGELTGKHHFNSALRTISDFDLLDGGVIIRHHYNPAWTIPYKYELVGVDMIDVSKHGSRKGEPKTSAGLVFNEWNQITHLWLYDSEDKRRSSKVPIDDITYYSEVWLSIGQQAAVSKLASILPTLDRIDQYTKAELNAAIESAKAGAYLRSTAYDEIMKIAIEEINKLSTIDGKVVEIKHVLQDLAKIGVGNYGLSPIPHSDEVIFNTEKRAGVYSDLNDNSEMKMASAIGMSSLGVYSKADKVNYSAMKYVSETDGLSTSIRFDNISNKVINVINTRLIQVGVQTGRISDRARYWKTPHTFNRFRYLRRNRIDVEPSKTAAANEKNIALGLKTKGQIVEETEGIKYEDHVKAKIAEEIMEQQMREKMYGAAGLPVPVIAPPAPAAEPTNQGEGQ